MQRRAPLLSLPAEGKTYSANKCEKGDLYLGDGKCFPVDQCPKIGPVHSIVIDKDATCRYDPSQLEKENLPEEGEFAEKIWAAFCTAHRKDPACSCYFRSQDSQYVEEKRKHPEGDVLWWEPCQRKEVFVPQNAKARTIEKGKSFLPWLLLILLLLVIVICFCL